MTKAGERWTYQVVEVKRGFLGGTQRFAPLQLDPKKPM